MNIAREKQCVLVKHEIEAELRQSRVAAAVDDLVERHKRLEMTIANEPLRLKDEIVDSLKQMVSEQNVAEKRSDEQKPVEHSERQKIVQQTAVGKSPEEEKVVEPEDASSYPQLPATLSGWLSILAVEGNALRKQLAVIESLRFQTIVEREKNIKEAHPATFEWLFDDGNTSVASNIPNTFLPWLTNQGGIYWVSGKAGSGKSTLMKFLCSHKKTSTTLRTWAAGKQLLSASYFFWNAGTGMQKSQQGLLQTLLFNILKQCPALVPLVTPSRWRKSGASNSDWTRAELLQVFKDLQEQPLDSARFCFFIDGLDEYDGDHTEIIEIMNSFTSSSAIKVCFSSRPWTVFEDAFGENHGQRIKLHDMTNIDITRFVTEKLAEGPSFRRLMQQSGKHRELIDEIVIRANGVFLWVFLVVQSLRRGMTNRDTIPELLERIRTIPVELEEFFHHILDSAERVYHKQAARLYLIRVCAPATLTAMDVSYFAEEGPTFALQYQVPSWGEINVHDRCLETRTRVAARCTDLLEFTDDDGIQFLHRTVKDFLETKDMQRLLDERAGENFNAHVYLCNSAVVQVKTFARKPVDVKPWQQLDILLGNFMHHAHQLEIRSLLDYSLITELEQAIVPLRTRTESKSKLYSYFWDSNFSVDDPRLEYDYRDGWLGDLALRHEIRGYEAIEAENFVEEIKQGRRAFSRPSLDILLLSTPRSRLQAEAVKLLLHRGANPNENTMLKSVWKRYLSSFEQSRILSSEEHSTCRVIQSLFEYGADPIFDGDESFFLDLMLSQFNSDVATSLEELRLKRKDQLKRSEVGAQNWEEIPQVNTRSQVEAAPVQKQKENQWRFPRLRLRRQEVLNEQ